MEKTQTELLSTDYEHPFDRRAINILKGTPGLESACSAIIKHGYERMLTMQHMGSCIRITPSVCGDVHEILVRCCEKLCMKNIPQLYVQWGYAVNAFTVGVHHPIIVLNSGSIDLLTEKEMYFLIGHELGHIKSAHMLYHMMAGLLESGGEILSQTTFGLGNVLSIPLQQALFYWSRMSEFTADRAGFLACENMESVALIMMKMAGLPRKYYGLIDQKNFMRQARDFNDLDYDAIGSAWKFLTQINLTHPWTVLRTGELIKWNESGEYDKIILRQYESHVTLSSSNTRKISCVKCGAVLGADISIPCRECGTMPLKIVLRG